MTVHALCGKSLGRLHKVLGRSTLATGLALKVRNQANQVIGQHLSAGADMRTNGEALLARTVSPAVSTFIDVGANVGDWSALILAHARSVRGLMFEPSQRADSILRQRFAGQSSLEIINVALADLSGFAQLFEEPGAGQTTSMVPGHSIPTAEPRAVRLSTLSEELSLRKWTRVDLLKIDAEGYDLRVLKGAFSLLKAQQLGIIQFEYNRPWAAAGSTLGEAIDLLQVCGYSVYLLLTHGLYQFNYERYREYYQYSNFVAVAPGSHTLVDGLIVGSV